MAVFANYLKAINDAYLNGDATEHTHRPALKAFIEGLGNKVTATNEPKRRTDCGMPDMKVSRVIRTTQQAFGYIECKDIGIDLKKEKRSEQLKRYLKAIDNLILTDYINFRFYQNGELIETAVLAKEGKGGKFVATEDGINDTKKLFSMFFASEPVQVKNPKELAERMAGMAKLLRGVVQETFKKENERGSLHEVYDAFKDVLIHDLTEDQFADMYTQTIVYGLFCARCFLNEQTVWGKDVDAIFAGIDGKKGEFSRQSAARLLPKTNPFLKKIFGHLELELDERIAWVVDDVVALLKNAQMGRIIKNFGTETKKKDPVIHFYETFLGQYDAKLRESRGVYYTPEPVVSYIVRSVDWLLKEKFGIRQGLRDDKQIRIKREDAPDLETHRCLILDPAVGTGTFLYEVIKQIHKKFQDKGAWPSYVEDHLLPRLFGFELMMAPYTVCHMKLGLLLRMLGYKYEKEKRLGVFLTNTLEEAEEITKTFWSSAISKEAREANTIKRDLPIMVVLGNPPYSNFGMMNQGKWILDLLEDYKKGLNEKKLNVRDDFIKFIRYGQYRIDQTGAGILAFITNNTYIDGITRRRMRESLLETFSEIYILNLHGDTESGEVCPDGSPDKNVFDIKQGVSIGIFIKEQGKEGLGKVYYNDLWGLRDYKYDFLNKYEVKNTEWQEIQNVDYNSCLGKFFFYTPKQFKNIDEYCKGGSINSIFGLNQSGIQTDRDELFIDFDQNTLKKRIKVFFSDEGLKEPFKGKYNVNNSSSYDLLGRREKNSYDEKCIDDCLYRPFDKRSIYYSPTLTSRPAWDVMKHIYNKPNLVPFPVIEFRDFS
ncbi:MAG: N-6 DNA methylase [Phycisphaerae bacterium]|nr:N-6 DNA methylase [Phycisphaerae bacterium]